MYNYH